MKRIKETGDFFWAESDRPWIQDGANVHVSMAAFDRGTEVTRTLDGKLVATINANLTAATDITQASVLAQNRTICFMGPSPKAPFDIDAATAQSMLGATGNPNGRPNSDVVRPLASAIDLARGSRGCWTIDFALMPMDEAAQYEAPFEYVRNVVLPEREKRRDDYRGCWWQYARPRPEMRMALKGLNRFIATPAVAKHRLFVWMKPEYLCNQGTLVFARADDYFFGVLHSHLHELWALAQGTQLEDRPRYTPTTCFETFPLPHPTPEQQKAIAEAAVALDTARLTWLGDRSDKTRTLTALYNKKPTWLDIAHRTLDAAVAAAYGWPADLSDEAILERLLELNRTQAAKP